MFFKIYFYLFDRPFINKHCSQLVCLIEVVWNVFYVYMIFSLCSRNYEWSLDIFMWKRSWGNVFKLLRHLTTWRWRRKTKHFASKHGRKLKSRRKIFRWFSLISFDSFMRLFPLKILLFLFLVNMFLTF